MCLLVIGVSLVQCLSNLLLFLETFFNKFILDASSFSDIYILKIQFSYSEACLFVFSVAPFKEQF